MVLAVFNVPAFVLPFIRGATFWVSYGVTTFAIVFSAGVALYAIGREGLKSKFLGTSLVYIVWVYLIIQVILGFVFMALTVVPAWLAIVVFVVLFGATAICLIAVDMGKVAIEELDTNVAEKVFYVKSLQVDVELLEQQVTEPKLKKSLKDLAEAIRYSDPMSHEKLAVLENKIENKVQQLSEAVEAGDTTTGQALADEIGLLLVERNKKCKLLKGA